MRTFKLPESWEKNKTAAAYLRGDSSVLKFFDYPPSTISLFDRLEYLRARDFKRQKNLVEKLAGFNREMGAGQTVMENIRALADENTFVILTGQQCGLFGGPLYTLYKTMTAIRMARELSATRKETFIPVLWAASEDHDIAEMDHLHIVDADNNLLRFQAKLDKSGYPAEYVNINDSVTGILDEIDLLFPNNDFKADILSHCRAFCAGTLSQSFFRFMNHLFGEFGLVLVNPFLFREESKDVLLRELEKPGEFAELVNSAGDALQAQHFHQQAHNPDACNLFRFEQGRRIKLRWSENQYRDKSGDALFSREDLKQAINKTPALFSPNVALRALAQEHLFPTAMQIVGPGEIAYWAQFKELFHRYNFKMPILYPRFSATLFEPKVAKSLNRLGFPETGIFTLEGDGKKILQQFARPEIKRRSAEFNDKILSALDALKMLGADVDSYLEKPLARFSDRIREEARKAAEKIEEADSRNVSNAAKDFERLSANLLPGGELQERKLNALPYLIRYGKSWMGSIIDGMNLNPGEHHLVYLGEANDM